MKPMYSTPGNPPTDQIPSADAFKKGTGVIMVGNFYVYYRQDDAPHFIVKEKDTQEVIGSATQYRDAIRLAARLDRKQSLSTPTGDSPTKTDSQAA